MYNGLFTVDFHTHIQDANTQLSLCPEDTRSSVFQLTNPIFERVANVSEPLHDVIARFIAMNYRGDISRYIYSKLGKIGLMECLRLFKTYGIEKLVEKMNQNGIDHSVIHSIEPLTCTSNIIELAAPYKGRFSIFASVDKNLEDHQAYIRPFIEAGTISGIKLHPIVGRYACGELYFRMKDVVQLAEEHDLPVMIHTGHIPVGNLSRLDGCTEAQALEPLLKAFPRVKFILAHIGWESWRQIIKLALRYPNVYVETSWQPAKIIRRSVDRLGAGRVLFGSDFPLFNQKLALQQVQEALSAREFVEVASINALRLLKINRPSQLARPFEQRDELIS